MNSSTPTLTRCLNIILNTQTNFHNRIAIENSFELINNIHIDIPNDSLLVYFDVRNLFPSSPPEECLYTEKFSFESSLPTPYTGDSVID